jgi:hypothetical protein
LAREETTPGKKVSINTYLNWWRVGTTVSDATQHVPCIQQRQTEKNKLRIRLEKYNMDK